MRDGPGGPLEFEAAAPAGRREQLKNLDSGNPMTLHARNLAAMVLATLAITPALAADGFKAVVGTALTNGGEKLARIEYTDGSSDTIKSGGLVHLWGGFEYQAGAFALQGNVGYHVDSTTARNGSVKFARYPVELLGFWQVAENVRLGGGLRKADGAKITSSGAASNLGSLKLESKLGAVLQGEYFFAGERFSAYGRYVAEDYKVDGISVSGKHVGAGVSFRF